MKLGDIKRVIHKYFKKFSNVVIIFVPRISKLIKTVGSRELLSLKSIFSFFGIILLYSFFFIYGIYVWIHLLTLPTFIIYIPKVIAVIFLLNFLFIYRAIITKSRSIKYSIILSQIIFVLFSLPVSLSTYTLYRSIKQSDFTLDGYYQMAEYNLQYNIIGLSGSNTLRLGSKLIGMNHDFSIIDESHFLTRWWQKIPIIGWYLRISTRSTIMDILYSGIFVRERIGDKLQIRAYAFDKTTNNYKLASVTSLPDTFPLVPFTTRNTPQIIVPSSIQWGANADQFIYFTNDLSSLIYVNMQVVRSLIKQQPNKVVHPELIGVNQLITVDTNSNLMYFSDADQEEAPRYYFAYDYVNNRTNSGDLNSSGATKLRYDVSKQKYINDVSEKISNIIVKGLASYEIPHLYTSGNSGFSDLYYFVTKDNGKEMTRLIWTRTSCDSNTRYIVLGNDDQYLANSGCVVLDKSFDGMLEPVSIIDFYGESKELLINSTNEMPCTKQRSAYVLQTNGQLLKLLDLPENLVRNNFSYKLIGLEPSYNESRKYNYELTSCLNDKLVYHASFARTASSSIIESTGPEYIKCTDEKCNTPAAKITIVDETGAPINPDEDPTVYINEENTFADIFFPKPNIGYLVTGIRDDVYQIFSTNFTAINVPIKKGMVHRYILDKEAKDRGEKNWITIMIDADGNGVYEESLKGGDVLTGSDFLKQCQRTCAGMEKL